MAMEDDKALLESEDQFSKCHPHKLKFGMLTRFNLRSSVPKFQLDSPEPPLHMVLY